MSNLPEQPDQPDQDDLFDAPAGVQDLSTFDDDQPMAGFAVGSDDEALKKMGRRTTPFGRIAFILLVGGAAVAAYFAWQGSKNYEARMDGLEACGAIEQRAEMIACVRQELESTSYDDVQERAIRNLGYFKDTESIPVLIQKLDNGGIVRRAAALALANIGLPDAEPAKQKLLDVLAETDERDGPQVVWALAVLREEAAADAIIDMFSRGLLQNQPGFSPRVITDVLGPERLASDQLLTHQEESVRNLTAQALAEVGSAEVVDALSRLIESELGREDKSQEVIRAAATGLGRAGDPRAAQPLFSLLEREPSMRQSVLDALKKTTGAPELAVLADQANEPAMKRDLVRLLAESHDPRVADKLAQLLGSDDDEIRATSANALAELGDARALPVLLQLAQGEDEGMADQALKGLVMVGSPDAAGELLSMLPSTCPDEPGPDMPAGCFRQAAILRALGASGNESAGERIRAALSGVDAPAAAIALAQMSYERAYDELLGKVKRPPDVDMTAPNAAERSLTNEDLLRERRGAIQAMGYYGRPDAAEDLMHVVEDMNDDYELRALAAASLGQIATPEMLGQVIQKVQDENVPEATRRYYVQALWQKPQPALNGQLLDLIASEAPFEVKRAAALAVGYSGDGSVDERLSQMLDDENARPHAAMAISLGGSEAAARRLVEVLADDSDAREILQTAIMGETPWFDLLTESSFESGQIWRRMVAARILQEGDDANRYGYAWLKTTAILTTGFDGPGGVQPPWIRQKLYEALNGDDAENRALAAQALADMNERGLLIRARDEGGAGASVARDSLDRLNRPPSMNE